MTHRETEMLAGLNQLESANERAYSDSSANEKQGSLTPDDPEGDESETLETLSQ